VRCSAVSVEDVVPFNAIQQATEVAFEDGASKITERYESFVHDICGSQPSTSRSRRWTKQCPTNVHLTKVGHSNPNS
jgi:hypothetical protein